MGVDGHRADLVMVRAAAAHAALEGRTAVDPADLYAVAPLVLAHRVRSTPFEADGYDEARVRSELASSFADSGGDALEPEEGGQGGLGADVTALIGGDGLADGSADVLTDVSVDLADQMDRARRAISGRRQESVSSDGRGRYSRSEPARTATADIALDATIRAAAPHQAAREGSLAINIDPADVHTKVRTRKVGASIAFCVDASGSMGADDRMAAAKHAVLELLVEAYQRRDRVGLVSFRGDSAEVVLNPTASVELAQIKLRSLPTGGATPLAAGLLRAIEMLELEIRRDSDTVPWLVLVTDGRANVGLNGGLGSEDARAVATRLRAMRIHTLVLDSGSGPRSSSAAKDIARAAGAEYVRLNTVDGAALAAAVRQRLTAS
jgi:magnesium chelatase subunit D